MRHIALTDLSLVSGGCNIFQNDQLLTVTVRNGCTHHSDAHNLDFSDSGITRNGVVVVDAVPGEYRVDDLRILVFESNLFGNNSTKYYVWG